MAHLHYAVERPSFGRSVRRREHSHELDMARRRGANVTPSLTLGNPGDAAGEAIYAAVFDAAPSLQSLFKTARCEPKQ